MNASRLLGTFAAATFIVILLAPGCSKSNNNSNPVSPAPGKELNSGNIGNGGDFSHTFATAGSFGYHCTIHAPMTGTITVDPSGGLDELTVLIVSSTSSGFQAQPVGGVTSIKVGGTVHWHNQSGTTHTVTSN